MSNNIKICMGSACFARGNAENIGIIEEYIKKNNIEADVEIIGARCEEKCAVGPNIYIDDVCYNGVTKESILKLLEGLKNE